MGNTTLKTAPAAIRPRLPKEALQGYLAHKKPPPPLGSPTLKTAPATTKPRLRGGEREFFVDNLLVRIHFIIVMIRWTGLAPWEIKPRLRGGRTHQITTFHGKNTPNHDVSREGHTKSRRFCCDQAALSSAYSRPMPRALWWSWGGGSFL